ncbi:hypothetical protein ACHAWC_001663, partial [Mediolabrus comicus]
TSSRIKDTKVAVEGKSTALVIRPPLPPQSSTSLVDDVSLTNYMRLPVEQYVLIEMPLGSSLTKLDGNNNSSYNETPTEFELVVPEITFFNLTLQPVVLCTVQPMDDKVVISSNNCYLRGSPFIEKTRLNERFDFQVRTSLTWNDDDDMQVLSKSSSADNNEQRNDDEEEGCSSITATTSIDVDVDVPRPFSSIPKFILQRTGNAAMKLSLKFIQANFVRNLANDYTKWCSDDEYRSYRASLSLKETTNL